MSARKYGRLSKFLTGAFVTFVAPVLTNLVAQQVGDWQQTLKYLLENEPPAATADCSRFAAQSVGIPRNRFTLDYDEYAEKSKTMLHSIPPRPLRSPR